jgi:tetratricopeptide (TPR) repeat protein
MFWPLDLAPFYPFRAGGPSLSASIAAASILVLVTIAAFAFRKTRPWLITGWCWYIVMLLPVIGIVQIGLQSHADRYTYLPQLGLYIALVCTIVPLISSRTVLAFSATAVLVILGTLAFHQTRFWANSRTLWEHADAVTRDNEVAENNLGMLDAHDGSLDRAVEHYERAIYIQQARSAARYDLTVALAENNLATAFARRGNVDQAVAHYTRAVQLRPDYADAFYNLGWLLLEQRKAAPAIDAFRAAIKTRPDDAAAHANLGDALHGRGEDVEARAEYERALKLAPDTEWAIYSLAWLLATSGDADVRDGERAAQIAEHGLELPGGNSPAMLRVLAAAYATQHRFADAVDVAQQAIELAVARRDEALTQKLQGDLELYRERVPVRDLGGW